MKKLRQDQGKNRAGCRRRQRSGDICGMTTQGTISRPDQPATDRVAEERAAMKAVLASSNFGQRPLLANLLEYICERYFEGETDAIKEYSIATDVFHRPHSFDQATDSIVRVEVFRLRKKLREFYEGEGANQPIEIVVATGHYRPRFIDRIPQVRPPDRLPDSASMADAAAPESEIEANKLSSSPKTSPLQIEGSHSQAALPARADNRPLGRRSIMALGAMLSVATAATLGTWWFSHGRYVSNNRASLDSTSSSIAPPSGPEVRIRCGYLRPIFKDTDGNVWMGDRYFTGGFVTKLPNQHIARTRNPSLYLTGRSGVFSYKIPVAPGVYEMRLHFAETTYSPTSTLGGGENSRVFDVQLNGRPLLSQFDIVSDAGANTADVRVFRDVTPNKDGYIHLDFSGSLGLPIINAIEIVPGLQHRLRPIRMVAQDSFFVDKAGNLWMPDTYFSSGQLADDKVVVGGTPEPGLYAGERYGNFDYAIPVDEGSYKVTLFFSEKYWGSGVSKAGGVGSRVFDIFCNGVALTRRMDIAKEAGSGTALIKTY
jgi:Malectin domain